MKRHLQKYKNTDTLWGWVDKKDIPTETYCGLKSFKWSERFSKKADKNIVDDLKNTTCKNCIKFYKKKKGSYGAE